MRVHFVAAIAVFVSMCAPAVSDERPPGPAPPPSAKAYAAPSASASVAQPVESASSDPTSPPAAPPPRRHAGKALIACGDKDCSSKTEMCCSANGESVCTKRAATIPKPDSPDDKFESSSERARLAFGDLCAKPLGLESLRFQPSVELGLCDDSSDCPKGTGCCEASYYNLLWGVNSCVKLRPDGSLPCAESELCSTEGAKCAVAHTACESGVCRREGRAIPCGERVCTGKTPVCCEGATGKTCVATREECGRGAVSCRNARDCGPGQYCCCGQDGSSGCHGDCEWGEGVSVLCESDRDCKGLGSGPPHCGESSWCPSDRGCDIKP